MTKTAITKAAAKFVVGTSTSFLVANVLRNNIETDSSIQTAQVYVGSVVIGVMAAEKTEDWTDQKIDAVIGWYQTSVKKH